MTAHFAFASPPTFGFSTEDIEGATLVVCRGRLTLEVAPGFREDVKRMFTTSQRIILDLDQVSHIDSSGIGALVQLYVSARKSGCELQLYNLSAPVKRLLGVTKVLDAFASCGSYLTRLP